MSKEFRLKIDLENDAFVPHCTFEIARILGELAENIVNEGDEHLSFYRNLRDINGNTVGKYAIKDTDND